MNKIIFVCTGNTCRSPMAEGLLKKKSNGIEITSRGIAVWSDAGANPLAIEAVSRFGVDISDHHAKPFKYEEVEGDTLVLTMTEEHANIIERQYPKLTGKVHTIKNFAGSAGDIEDPYGFDLKIYEDCAKELDRLTDKIAEQYNNIK